jgi:hypothetical protein
MLSWIVAPRMAFGKKKVGMGSLKNAANLHGVHF